MLVAATMGAGAWSGSQLVVGGNSTTNSDFQNATTRTNMTVGGDSISASGTTVLEGFEDGTWPDDWTGDTGDFDVVSNNPKDGTYNLRYGGSGGTFSNVEKSISAEQYDSLSFWVYSNGFGARNAFQYRNGSAVAVWLYVTAGSEFSDPGSVAYNDGGNVVDTGIDINTGQYYEFNVTNIDYATYTFDLTVHDSSGTVVGSASNLDFNSNENQIDAIYLNFPQEANVWDIDSFTKPGAGSYAAYISQNYSVEQSEQGFANISTLTNASATVAYEAWDGSQWIELSSATYTSAANHTQTWSASAYEPVRTNITVENQSANGEMSFKLNDDGVQFTANAPTVDNASATPTGDLTQATNTFEIGVNDSDFQLAQGDSVTAVLKIDDSKVGEDTITTNSTAQVTASISEGGDHTYHWELEDSYGGTAQSDTFSIKTPGELYLRNISNTSQLVKSPTNVTVRFISNDTIVPERTVTDGTVNLSGVPVDQPIVVDTYPNSHYTHRTVWFRKGDIYEQQSMYFLNTSAYSSIESRFVLEDPTGTYSENSILYIKRPIELNGTVESRA